MSETVLCRRNAKNINQRLIARIDYIVLRPRRDIADFALADGKISPADYRLSPSGKKNQQQKQISAGFDEKEGIGAEGVVYFMQDEKSRRQKRQGENKFKYPVRLIYTGLGRPNKKKQKTNQY